MDELRAALKNNELDLICPEYHSYAEADRNGLSISETIMNIPMGILSLGPIDSNDVDIIATGGTSPGLVYLKENFPNADFETRDSVDALIDTLTGFVNNN